MSIEDPITKILKDGQEKMGINVQKSLLTQLSGMYSNYWPESIKNTIQLD